MKLNVKKIMIIFSSILGIILVISILFLFKTNKTDVELLDGKKFKYEYEYYNEKKVRGSLVYPEVQIKKDNIVKYADVDTVLKLIGENKSAVIYIGYSSCLYCRTAVQTLLDAAEKTDLETIYYLDISKIWFEKELSDNNKVVSIKKATDEYYKLMSVLDDEFLEDYKLLNNEFEYIDTNEERLKVPLVLFLTNGYISSYHIGTVSSQLDPLIKLDKSQIDGLKNIYSVGINDVLSNMNNKKNAGF